MDIQNSYTMGALRISLRPFFGMEVKRSALRKSLKNFRKRNELTYLSFLIRSKVRDLSLGVGGQLLEANHQPLITNHGLIKKFVYMSEMLYICAKLEDLELGTNH